MDLNKLRVRRSFIFTPGLQPEMFPKALASGADMVCIELEDGIAMKDKDEARKNTIDALKSLEAGCNLVLYCSGKTNDNFKLINSLPYIDRFTIKKTSEFYNFLR